MNSEAAIESLVRKVTDAIDAHLGRPGYEYLNDFPVGQERLEWLRAKIQKGLEGQGGEISPDFQFSLEPKPE